MATYVMADIHGQYEKFLNMLELILFSDEDKLYIIGDMVDRGPKSLDVLRYIKNSPNMEALMGNHEDMLLDVIIGYGMTGSLATSMVSGTNSEKTYKALRKLWYKDRGDAARLIQYLKQLPLYKKLVVNGQEYLLVHAGIREEDVEQNKREDLLWIREEFYKSKKEYPFTVVFGHTPTKFITGVSKIFRGPSMIGIDCGAPFEDGALACLRLDDQKEFYVK